MLYVKRLIGTDKFVVADTDDSTEQTVTMVEIVRAIRLGLDIKGVSLCERRVGPNLQKVVEKVVPYQPVGTASPAQVKAQMLLGVDVVAHDGVVTRVHWDEKTVKPMTRVRLSNFAHKVGDAIIDQTRRYLVPIVLVLDNKLTVSKDSFFGFCIGGCKVDLTECRDEVADLVYNSWVLHHDGSDAKDCIFDNPDRMLKWRTIGVVYNGYVPSAFAGDIEEIQSKSAVVERMFYEEFAAVANAKFVFASTPRAKSSYSKYISFLSRRRNFWSTNPTDFESIRQIDNLQVFHSISEVTTLSDNSVAHFYNFMAYCISSERVQKEYVKLVLRFNEWCWKMYHRR